MFDLLHAPPRILDAGPPSLSVRASHLRTHTALARPLEATDSDKTRRVSAALPPVATRPDRSSCLSERHAGCCKDLVH